jgi:hypothetical protein
LNADDVENFLSRWSRKKLQETRPDPQPEAQPQVAEAGAEPSAPAVIEPPAPEPLPAVESLTPESDFKPFMRPDVEPGVKQAALKQLFKDPHFNVMDGLDTYIDDYSKPDPIPEEMMKKMYQARELLFTPEEKAAAEAEDARQAAAEAAEQAERDRQAEELQQAFAQPVSPPVSTPSAKDA